MTLVLGSQDVSSLICTPTPEAMLLQEIHQFTLFCEVSGGVVFVHRCSLLTTVLTRALFCLSRNRGAFSPLTSLAFVDPGLCKRLCCPQQGFASSPSGSCPFSAGLFNPPALPPCCAQRLEFIPLYPLSLFYPDEKRLLLGLSDQTVKKLDRKL